VLLQELIELRELWVLRELRELQELREVQDHPTILLIAFLLPVNRQDGQAN